MARPAVGYCQVQTCSTWRAANAGLEGTYSFGRSMSPEGTLTEQTASASGSLGSQGRGNDEGIVYETPEGAVKGEDH